MKKILLITATVLMVSGGVLVASRSGSQQKCENCPVELCEKGQCPACSECCSE